MSQPLTGEATRALSPEDAEEYQRRLAAARELMARHGFDALAVSDFSSAQPRYSRFFSGFHIPAARSPLVAIVPSSDEPVLVVPPGIRRSWSNAAHARSWIPDIVSTYVDDADWEAPDVHHWGLNTQPGSDVVDALRRLGLDSARIGIAGTWADIEETKAQLPLARFEPTLVEDADGRAQDQLEPLIGVNSSWEIKKLEAAHSASDVITRAFVEAACAGATINEASIQAKAAGRRAGADEEIRLYGTPYVEPWSFWDFGLADRDERFQREKLYFVEVAGSSVDGYGVQSGRCFVVGSPTTAQVRFAKIMQRSIEALFANIAPGKTGAEMWEAGLTAVTEPGLEPWAEFGHIVGYQQWTASPSRIHFRPKDQNTIHEGQALAAHVCLTDKIEGFGGFIGDTILVEEGGGWRHLSSNPSPYELVTC